MDQSQFCEHLFNSLMMNKDKNQVNEKVLNLTLEIIFLLTGEDCIIVKKRSDHVTDSSSPSESEGLCRTQSPVLDHPLNSLTHEGHNDSKKLHPPPYEVPVRCEDVAVYLSMEEWEYLEEHKEHYKEVMRENPQPIGSQGCENVNSEKDNGIVSDSELSVTDHQDPQETVHSDTCADESGNRNTPERCPICPCPQHCTEEDTVIPQDYQMELEAVIFPKTCKEEEISTDIRTDSELPGSVCRALFIRDYESRENEPM
ncbi:oocyte zinc finger protein XlCOF7.1-like [Rhinophrynus dorsalis]